MRPPAVSGAFYPSSPANLNAQLKKFFESTRQPVLKSAVAAIVPHAGYMYSGQVAAYAYSALPKADSYIILGPNHHGVGSEVSIMAEGEWGTPLGNVRIDSGLAAEISKCEYVDVDEYAHLQEHSIEVQLPFLQYRFKSPNFVPICLMQSAFSKAEFLSVCRSLAESIFNAVQRSKKRVVLIASSDFSHYVPQEVALKNDTDAIDSIKRLDESEFLGKVLSKKLSICGFGCIATAIAYSKKMGAQSAALLKYSTSGDVTEDRSAVVGYASLVI